MDDLNLLNPPLVAMRFFFYYRIDAVYMHAIDAYACICMHMHAYACNCMHLVHMHAIACICMQLVHW